MVNPVEESLESCGPITRCFTLPVHSSPPKKEQLLSFFLIRGYIGRQEALPLLSQIAQGHGQTEYQLQSRNTYSLLVCLKM